MALYDFGTRRARRGLTSHPRGFVVQRVKLLGIWFVWVKGEGWECCGMMSGPGKITERITRFFFDQSPDYFLDKKVLSMVIAQMVKFIAKGLEEKEGMRRYS